MGRNGLPRCNGRAMRFALALILATPALTRAASPDPADLVPTPEVQVRCRALVRQLGNEDYEQREDAQKKLSALGRFAHGALIAGVTESDDPEIRTRCGQLLPKAAEADFQARLETFLADPTGRYEHDVPGWKAFRTIACDEWRLFGVAVSADRSLEKAAKEVFVELMATRANRELVRAVDGSPLVLGERVVARKLELYEARYPSGGPSKGRTATVDEVAALTFAEALAGTQYVPRRAVSVSYLINLSGFDTAARAGDDKAKVYTALAVAWLNSRTDPREMTDAMNLAARLGMTDRAADLAARVLITPGVTSIVRSRAVSTLSSYGTKKHIVILDRAANDANVVYSIVKSPALPTYEVQLRDIALGLSLVFTEQKLSDYGFSDRYATVNGFENASYSHTRYYFEDDGSRKKAFEKWAEWRKANDK